MVVQVGVMELPVTEDPDDIQTYMNGEHVTGGLWTALTRSSNHDHSGGLNGVQLGATSIPDGSITTAKLDPAVLLPYALVDGSKPFTGQVTMQADAIVRDTLYFGQQGSALPADATLSRTGPGALRADTHLGVGVTPAAWGADLNALQVGQAGAVVGGEVGHRRLLHQQHLPRRARASTPSSPAPPREVALENGDVRRPQLPLVRRRGGPDPHRDDRPANSPATGTLTLTPDAGQAALHRRRPPGARWSAAAGTSTLRWPSGHACSSGARGTSSVRLSADNTLRSGTPPLVASSTPPPGTIHTSSRTVKEGITPLDPAACYQAAKDVRWYEFAYLPPAYTEPEPPPDIAYDAADDNETKAEKKALRDEAEAQAKAAHLKMVAETAPARHQRGFVFPAGADAKDEAGGTLPPVPDLFGLEDRQSTTPQADLATLGCAMQEIIRRLEALEAA